MSGWHVEPHGLQSSVTTVSEQINAVAALFVGADGALSARLGEQCVDVLADSTGFDGVVFEAVSGLMVDQLTNRVGPALAQYTTAVESTVAAAEHVRAGEEQQAGDIATAMRTSGSGGGLFAGGMS